MVLLGGTMLRLIVLIVLTLAAAATSAAEQSKPVGTNCGLSIPPPNAGEELNHGTIARIYHARATSMGHTAVAKFCGSPKARVGAPYR